MSVVSGFYTDYFQMLGLYTREKVCKHDYRTVAGVGCQESHAQGDWRRVNRFQRSVGCWVSRV